MILSPPEDLVQMNCTDADGSVIACEVRKRIYLYGFMVGSMLHMLSIALGMAFVNALNEAARDSDVFRMFAYGKGYRATRRCQLAFSLGCLLDFLALGTAAEMYIGWEAMIILPPVVVGCCLIGKQTSDLLFNCSSIRCYWKRETNPDDPYDLHIPVQCFAQRAKIETEMRATDEN